MLKMGKYQCNTEWIKWNFIDNIHKHLGKSIRLALHSEHLSPTISFDLHKQNPFESHVVELDPFMSHEQAEIF